MGEALESSALPRRLEPAKNSDAPEEDETSGPEESAEGRRPDRSLKASRDSRKSRIPDTLSGDDEIAHKPSTYTSEPDDLQHLPTVQRVAKRQATLQKEQMDVD